MFPIAFADIALLSYEVGGKVIKEFLPKKTCELLGFENLVLVEINRDKINCMGTKVGPFEACKKILPRSASLINAQVREDEGKLICILGEKVNLKLKCDKFSQICSNSLRGCEKLRREFANSLSLFHHSLTSLLEDSNSKTLNCYFTKIKY